MGAVPRLCEFYPGICLTTEEKARKNVSQGSRRMPAGTMKIHKHKNLMVVLGAFACLQSTYLDYCGHRSFCKHLT